MKDAKTTLDDVRAKIPADAKVLIAWQAPGGGPLILSQANIDQRDLNVFAASITDAAAKANAAAKKVRT